MGSPVNPLADDILVSTKQLAELLFVSVEFLEAGRCSGGKRGKSYGPKFVRLSRNVVRYRMGDVRTWLAARSLDPTAPQRAASK